MDFASYEDIRPISASAAARRNSNSNISGRSRKRPRMNSRSRKSSSSSSKTSRKRSSSIKNNATKPIQIAFKGSKNKKKTISPAFLVLVSRTINIDNINQITHNAFSYSIYLKNVATPITIYYTPVPKSYQPYTDYDRVTKWINTQV